MMASTTAAPTLYTPDDVAPPPAKHARSAATRSDDELYFVYDIERTLSDLRAGRYRRIALQFPDSMLPDAPRVFQLLSRGLSVHGAGVKEGDHQASANHPAGHESSLGQPAGVCGAGDNAPCCGKASGAGPCCENRPLEQAQDSTRADDIQEAPQLYILGDTSYGECCVDEIAAEHVDADVVVHYGRSCLSPTQRLPVIYVFTHSQLDLDAVVAAFSNTFEAKDTKVCIVADVTHQDHVAKLAARLANDEGYSNIFATDVVHQPSCPIPNRTVPPEASHDPEVLRQWHVFHISSPPDALLLTLSSRVASIRIYPTDHATSGPTEALTTAALRRRYAILTKLSTVPIFGILVNTLSVKDYMHVVEHVKAQIAAAGKKSYLFVVGKLNTAKLANFSEIGGWVVIGCWESSLVDSSDFYAPIITPYELQVALEGDANRLWTGQWRSDYQSLLSTDSADGAAAVNWDAGKQVESAAAGTDATSQAACARDQDDGSEDESAPPEFDLRTGRYVSASITRPMQQMHLRSADDQDGASASILSQPSDSAVAPRPQTNALAKRAMGDVATIKGVVSPGAEFLRSQRTWQGLGSDFEIRYEEDDEAEPTTAVQEGRSGIARGYTVGEDRTRR
ncbi:Diphthamide biosynthesis protein 2 [Ascosphaera acerosa]|nr:Diphthamide biosynthesis protein 2 [Ascosphaera acerosa]